MTKKNRPQFITFTGADKLSYLGEMVWMSQHYPIEWGILLSKKKQGTPRYPDQSVIETLECVSLDYALHVCGEYCREILDTGTSDYVERLVSHIPNVRMQLNASSNSYTDDAIRLIQKEGWFGNTDIIIQARGSFRNDLPEGFYQLLDASGGRGVRMPQPVYPKNHDDLVGYAGGFGPDYLPVIEYNQKYWIDMENNIRTNEEFDLQKCWDVCRKVYS